MTKKQALTVKRRFPPEAKAKVIEGGYVLGNGEKREIPIEFFVEFLWGSDDSLRAGTKQTYTGMHKPALERALKSY